MYLFEDLFLWAWRPTMKTRTVEAKSIFFTQNINPNSNFEERSKKHFKSGKKRIFGPPRGGTSPGFTIKPLPLTSWGGHFTSKSVNNLVSIWFSELHLWMIIFTFLPYFNAISGRIPGCPRFRQAHRSQSSCDCMYDVWMFDIIV